jgi:hypothetical protein
MSYSPASVVTSGALAQLQAIHYEREAIPNLKANTPFLSMTKQKPLPLRQGNQIQFFTYSLLAANLNQAAEGTVNKPAVLKFGYIGGNLRGVSDNTEERPARESVETNTPNSPVNGLKIESELIGDYESAPVVTLAA